MPGYFDDIPAYILNQLFILLNDFTYRETRLHNADWFDRMITLGSIQRYAVYMSFYHIVFFTVKPSDMRY